MTRTWSLNTLYSSFDSPELKKDLAYLETLNASYDDVIKALSGTGISHKEAIEGFLNQYIQDLKTIRLLAAFGHLSFSTHSKSQEALSLKSKAQEGLSSLTKPLVAFTHWLKGVDNFDALAEESSLIKEHLFFLQGLKDSAQHMLSQEEEVLVSKLKASGVSAWETLQSKVSSQLTCDLSIDGNDLTLPIMTVRNMAYSSDPNVRKKAYEAELAAYQKHADVSAAALNSIKGDVLLLSHMRGFESPLDETLFQSKMDRRTLDALIQSMEAHLPLFHRYLSAKAKHLGLNGPLPFYDLFAPVVESDVNYTIDEAKAFITQHFSSFSEQLGTFASTCFERQWLDFEPREGKVGGAFCSNIPSIGESRILLNFTGKLKNVFTIAHELGHAYHGHCLKQESILNTSYPMPLAETASIFCETIVRHAALKNADDTLKLAILENSLMSATSVIVDILSRYYFETQVFERRQENPLTVDDLKGLMIDAQKRAYGHAIDHNKLHPYMWLNKTHYYYANRNFYNFPYAFGLLFAKGLYSLYEKQGSTFITTYNTLLKNTGKMTIEDVCASVGINPMDKAFWNSSFKHIERDVIAFEKLVSNV